MMSKQIVEVFRKTTTRVKSIAFHPTNPVMITANHCGTVYVWNIFYQQVISVLREHSGSVRCVKIHPSGEIFATAGDDKIIRIWNYKTRKVVQLLKGHTDYVRSIDFHPTKPWLVSGSDDCTVRVWNIYTGEQLSSSTGHTHYVMSVLFVDDNHILSGSLDHTIGVWNCSNLFEKKKFMVPDVVLLQTIEAHSKGVNHMFQYRDCIVSGSDDREIKIWKYSNEILVLDKGIYNHDGNITSVFNDGESIYGGGEDSIFSVYSNGKSIKNNVGSRVWAIAGRDDYLALGTDDGIIFYRNSVSLTGFVHNNCIYYAMGNLVSKYNMKQSFEYCKTKMPVRSMFLKDDSLYLTYDQKYEVFEDERKTGGDVGSIAFLGNDKYHLKDSEILKNGASYRTDIEGVISSQEGMLFVVDKKSLTVISGDKERSSTYNFVIKSVVTNGKTIAVFGSNRILILNESLDIMHTVDELVEINGGIFYDDILIYSTVKQLRFFYEDTGILQSVDSYVIPVMAADEYLYVLSRKGVEKILLNMSEIRFRRAVLNDDNILSVIEEEQLPGLSPLEYLMKKNRGGIALPFINDDEKRFQLFLNDCNYDEALKLCSNSKMYDELGFHSLKNGQYDISEICFRRNNDETNLFYLLLCTKQLDKLKDLQNEEIENMVKIITEDRSILQSINTEEKLNHSNLKEEKLNHSNLKEEKLNRSTATDEITAKVKEITISKAESDKSVDSSNEEEGANSSKVTSLCSESESCARTDQATMNDSDENLSSSEENESSNVKNSASDNESCNVKNSNESVKNEENCNVENSASDNESCNVENGASDKEITNKSDNAPDKEITNKSSDASDKNDENDFQSQIFDLSEVDLEEDLKDSNINELYQSALELTTIGKFSKAIEIFRKCISVIALKLTSSTDHMKQRKLIGNYLLGLHLEKSRKNIEDPAKNIQLSLFFSDLELDEIHIPLVKNLAMTTCFKHGNLKTAHEIAQKYPECKNSTRILNEKCETDSHSIESGYICFDTVELAVNPKECALCFVKSEEGEICQACKIGVLH